MTRTALFLALFSLAACGGADDAAAPSASPGGAEPEEPSAPSAPAGGDASRASPPAGEDAGAEAAAPKGKSYALGPSAGCAKTSGAKGLDARTINVSGKKRDYLRFVPAGYQPGTEVALVLGFHGSGGTAAKARATFDLEAKAGKSAIFLYPQGLPDPAFDGDNRWDPTAGSDDLAFIDAIIAETSASHCIDRDRVFAVGFSNGARMTSMLGCYRGDVIRAVAPVAPGGNKTTLPLASGACVGEVAVWEGLGTADADHEKGATLVRDYYRTANGCAATRSPATPAGCETYDGCRAEVPTTWCTYPAGHAWPSFGAGAVWSFFSKL